MIRLNHDAIAAASRAAPGEWLPILRGPTARLHSLVNAWRNRKRPEALLGPFVFEARATAHGSGEAVLFVRYVPPRTLPC